MSEHPYADVSLPVGFELIAKTEHYLDKKDGKEKQRSPKTKNKISAETIALIEKMAKEKNLTSLRSQSWETFLKSQADNTWACDFTVVNDWLFRQWHIFVVMELEARRIVHTGITKFPTDEWTAQQLREATPWGKGPKYLIHDRDGKYGRHFSAVANATNIKELKTPYL